MPDAVGLVKTIQDLNQEKKVKINIVLLWYRDADLEKLLKQIAVENSGQIRFVSEKNSANSTSHETISGRTAGVGDMAE